MISFIFVAIFFPYAIAEESQTDIKSLGSGLITNIKPDLGLNTIVIEETQLTEEIKEIILKRLDAISEALNKQRTADSSSVNRIISNIKNSIAENNTQNTLDLLKKLRNLIQPLKLTVPSEEIEEPIQQEEEGGISIMEAYFNDRIWVKNEPVRFTTILKNNINEWQDIEIRVQPMYVRWIVRCFFFFIDTIDEEWRFMGGPYYKIIRLAPYEQREIDFTIVTNYTSSEALAQIWINATSLNNLDKAHYRLTKSMWNYYPEWPIGSGMDLNEGIFIRGLWANSPAITFQEHVEEVIMWNNLSIERNLNISAEPWKFEGYAITGPWCNNWQSLFYHVGYDDSRFINFEPFSDSHFFMYPIYNTTNDTYIPHGGWERLHEPPFPIGDTRIYNVAGGRGYRDMNSIVDGEIGKADLEISNNDINFDILNNTVNVSFRIFNIGYKNSENFVAQITEKNIVTGELYILDYYNIDNIAPGSFIEISFIWIPESENRLIYVFADRYNQVDELKENNNKASKIFFKMTDLTLDNIYFSNPSPTELQEIEITSNIYNYGYADVINAKIGLFIDNKIIDWKFIDIPADSNEQVSFVWEAEKGNHEVSVSVDPNNLIWEIDETNNVADRSIGVGPANVKFLFVPIKWNLTKEEFYQEIDNQMYYFIRQLDLNNCPEKLGLKKLNPDIYNLQDFDCNNTINRIDGFVQNLGINVEEYKNIIGVVKQTPCERAKGANYGKLIWASLVSDNVFAHEIGHTYGLADEYCSNQAGSTNPSCNDGDIQGDGYLSGDWNYLDPNMPFDCPPDGSNASDDQPCCNYFELCENEGGCYMNGTLVANYLDSYQRTCSANYSYEYGKVYENYGICCKGNVNSYGGRAIMSNAYNNYGTGIRAYDDHSLANLTGYNELNCGGLREEVNLQVIDFAFTIYKNDTILPERLYLKGNGTETLFHYSPYNEHRIIIYDSENNTLFNNTFEVYFGYSGPVLEDDVYYDIEYDYIFKNFVIAYNDNMYNLSIYHNNSLLFSSLLNFCNNNNVCDFTESYLSCPQDCPLDQNDGLCINEIEGICDPDCGEDVDLDCRADLKTKNEWVSYIPSFLTNGTEAEINVTIFNNGTRDVTSFSLDVFEGLPYAEENKIFSTIVEEELEPDNYITKSFNYTVPYGSHDLYFVLDRNNSINETYEINNEAYTRLVTGQMTDLSITSSDITFSPDELNRGEVVQINASISNTGNYSAIGVLISFYYDEISFNNKIGERSLGLIESGNNEIVSIDFIADEGTNNIFIVIDEYNELPETNESNNIANNSFYANSPPELDFIEDVSGYEFDEIVITATASDPENDSLTFSINDSRFEQNDNIFTWQTDDEDSGTFSVRIAVSDGALIDWQNVGIIVYNINRPPMIFPIDDIVINETDLVRVEPNVTDPDNENNVTNDDNNLTFYFSQPLNESGEWQTGYEDAGIYDVNVTVSDGEFDDMTNFTITVLNVNRVPTINISDQFMNNNALKIMNLSLYSSDPDRDELAYNILEQTNPLVANCSIEGEILNCSSYNLGETQITIEVNDSEDNTIDTFTLYVMELYISFDVTNRTYINSSILITGFIDTSNDFIVSNNELGIYLDGLRITGNELVRENSHDPEWWSFDFDYRCKLNVQELVGIDRGTEQLKFKANGLANQCIGIYYAKEDSLKIIDEEENALPLIINDFPNDYVISNETINLSGSNTTCFYIQNTDSNCNNGGVTTIPSWFFNMTEKKPLLLELDIDDGGITTLTGLLNGREIFTDMINVNDDCFGGCFERSVVYRFIIDEEFVKTGENNLTIIATNPNNGVQVNYIRLYEYIDQDSTIDEDDDIVFFGNVTANVAEMRLTYASGDSKSPSIAIDSNNNVHIAWYDRRDGNYEIYYTKLDNDGNTLVDDRRLTFDSDNSARPSLSLDSNNNVHIAWHNWRDGNAEIYYTKLDNNGNTIVDDRRLTFAPADSRYPSLAIDSNNNVHIAWDDGRDGNFEIYYTKLDNNGNTLVDDTRLTFAPDYSEFPSLSLDSNNNVHIAWYDWMDGNAEIYYTKLDNNGSTIVDDMRLTFDSSGSWKPSLGLDSNNNVHIAWEDWRNGNGETYYTKLDNNGSTIVDDRRLTFDPADSWYPSIAIDSNNNVHIAWMDDRDGNFGIYYTKLDNNGNTLVDDRRLTFAPAYSGSPSLALDSNNNMHIAWYDSRDGNWEIYYTKRDNDGNPISNNFYLYYDDANEFPTERDFIGDFVAYSADDGDMFYSKFYGNETFSPLMRIHDVNDGNSRAVGVADFDNDRDYDILKGSNNDNIYYYEQIGFGLFNNRTVIATTPGNNYHTGFAVGDYNNDANMDAVVGASEDLFYLEGLGNGSFVKYQITDEPWTYTRDLDSGDFNNDGNLDFAIGSYSGSGASYVYLGNGNGTFQSATQIANSDVYNDDSWSLCAADYNNDTVLDVLINNGGDGKHYFYAGYGDGTFADGVLSFDMNNFAKCDNFNIDSDTNDDILLATYTSRWIQYYRSNADTTFNFVRNIGGIEANPLGISFPYDNHLPLEKIAEREDYVTQTDFAGGFNYTFRAPDEGGNYTLKVNLSFNGVYGEFEKNIRIIRFPPKITLPYEQYGEEEG